MNPKFKQTLFELNEQLNFINLEMDDLETKSVKSTEILLKVINNIKKQFLKDKTMSLDSELDFFKNIKPKFTSLYIYHNAIFKIETKMPHRGENITKKYLNKELKKLKRFFRQQFRFLQLSQNRKQFSRL